MFICAKRFRRSAFESKASSSDAPVRLRFSEVVHTPRTRMVRGPFSEKLTRPETDRRCFHKRSQMGRGSHADSYVPVARGEGHECAKRMRRPCAMMLYGRFRRFKPPYSESKRMTDAAFYSRCGRINAHTPRRDDGSSPGGGTSRTEQRWGMPEQRQPDFKSVFVVARNDLF